MEPPTIESRLDVLLARGCAISDPAPSGEGFACEARLPDGQRVRGEGRTGDEAVARAVDLAERLIDVVEEASLDSFPASDPPGYGGGPGLP